MTIIRRNTAIHRLNNSETVSRRRSTRSRKSPGEWWKGGTSLPVSTAPNVAKPVSSRFSNDFKRVLKRRTANNSKSKSHGRLKTRGQGLLLSKNKDIAEGRGFAQGGRRNEKTGDEGSTLVHDSRATQSQRTTQREISNDDDELVLEKTAINASQPPFSDSGPAHTKGFGTGCPRGSSSPTNPIQHAKVRIPPENGNVPADKPRRFRTHITKFKATQDPSIIDKTNSIQVSSAIVSGFSDIAILNPDLLQDASGSSHSNSKYSKASGVVLSEEMLSRYHSAGRSTSASASVSQNLPRHGVEASTKSRLSGSFVQDEMLQSEIGHGLKTKAQRASTNKSSTLKKVERNDTRLSSDMSPKVNTTSHIMIPNQFIEPERSDDPDECVNAETFAHLGLRTPRTCSNCRSQVCICERKLYPRDTGNATVQSVMGFKVRRGSKISYMTENDFGNIKFGIRTCSDGILVGELALHPHSATGPRRTVGRKELYILLRGFLILEVDDSTIHMRQGDEVEFEEDTVFELQNPYLQSAELLCFLLSAE